MNTPRDIAEQAEFYRQFAAEHEGRILEAIALTGSLSKAAISLGITRSAVQRAMRRLGRRAVLQGYSPTHDMTKVVPEPFRVKGVSTYYDSEGKPRGQWVKSTVDRDKLHAMMLEAAGALAESLPRVRPIVAPVQHTVAALCNQYTLTDAHIGMLAWHEEGGADWDLKIAESTLVGAFEAMVAGAPAAGTAVIAQLGDWMHIDGLVPVTPTSGHALDVDSRFAKIVRAAIRIMRRCVDLSLQKHESVVLVLAEGNHDPASSVWLGQMFAALYENEPRLKVIDTPLPYYAMQHGKTMLAYHHGHKRRADQNLALLIAAQFSEMWGRTAHRYVHTGHLHHVDEKGMPGIRVVQHPTLAARDSFSSRGGWLSERQAAAITYHAEFGEVARTIITPEMLQ